MKTWIITTVATVVLMGLGGLLIHKYGEARFEAGEASARTECSDSVLKSVNDGAKEFERIQNETQNLDDISIDNELYKLGIMRTHSDR